MSTEYGVTSNGFVRRTFDEIIEAKKERYVGIDSSIDLTSDSLIYKLLKDDAYEIYQLEEKMEAIYYEGFLSTASSEVSVDHHLERLGMERQEEQNSSVLVQVEGAVGAVIPDFYTIQDIEGRNWVVDSGAEIVSSPQDFKFVCESSGEIILLAGHSFVFSLPAGVTGMSNDEDAAVGNLQQENEEVIAQFKIRLESLQGSSPNAIESSLLMLDGVTQVFVINNTSVDYLDGTPPKAIEALVLGGEEQEIFELLFNKVSGGIETYGNQSTIITASNGRSYPVSFSRPTEVLVYVSMQISVNSDVFPSDGGDQIKEAIVLAGLQRKIGDSVSHYYILSSFSSVVGIEDVTLYFGLSSSPSMQDTLVVGAKEILSFSSTNIEIVL